MPVKRSRQHEPASGSTNRVDAFFAAGAVALCALVITAMAWTRPTTTPTQIDYQQVGHLSYLAPTSSSSVYGGSSITTGQPVYTNAVSNLTVSYAYRLVSSSPSNVHGTEQLVATIDNGQGVRRSFDLQSLTAFSGAEFRAQGTLHLSDLQTAASAYEQMATVDGAAAYMVSITPHVALSGGLGGATLRAAFNKPVQFDYRPSSSTSVGVLSPVRTTSLSPSSSAGSAAVASGPITATLQGGVSRPGGTPATLFGLSVRNARIGAPVLLAGALFVLFLLGRGPIRDLTDGDERRRISARHGAAMVEVDSLPSAPLSTVELSSFEGLLKVARRLGCPLLHQEGVTSVYAVVDGATVYRYVVADGFPGRTFAPGQTGFQASEPFAQQSS